MKNQTTLQVEREITPAEAQEITLELKELLKNNSNRSWEISRLLHKIMKTKGYKIIDNPNTSKPYKSFEEYCLVVFDLARNTAFHYVKAKDYLDEHHPNVQPGEHLDYTKLSLLSSIDKEKYKEEWKELDEKVITNSISKRELEEEISKLKKNGESVIEITRAANYDENIYYILPKLNKRYGKEVICIDRTRGESKERIFKKHFPTVTRFCNFFKNNGLEFSLREYAKVQDFPDNFKFAGGNQEIRSQIGEAVSPKMAEYIIKKHIKGKTFIELFCGCGGFSLGAYNLGKVCKFALDVNKYSLYSYKLNFPKVEVENIDIRRANEKEIYKRVGKVDFIIGGPPCQGFSVAGLKLDISEDPRNQLYLEFIRFLKCFKPKQFIMENVPPILNYKDQIISNFEKIGYSMKFEKVDGLSIGMKQKRIRVFFIGCFVNGDWKIRPDRESNSDLDRDRVMF